MRELKLSLVKTCDGCKTEVSSDVSECPLCKHKFEEEETNYADENYYVFSDSDE